GQLALRYFAEQRESAIAQNPDESMRNPGNQEVQQDSFMVSWIPHNLPFPFRAFARRVPACGIFSAKCRKPKWLWTGSSDWRALAAVTLGACVVAVLAGDVFRWAVLGNSIRLGARVYGVGDEDMGWWVGAG